MFWQVSSVCGKCRRGDQYLDLEEDCYPSLEGAEGERLRTVGESSGFRALALPSIRHAWPRAMAVRLSFDGQEAWR
jgi:hypothetical protein